MIASIEYQDRAGQAASIWWSVGLLLLVALLLVVTDGR